MVKEPGFDTYEDKKVWWGTQTKGLAETSEEVEKKGMIKIHKP